MKALLQIAAALALLVAVDVAQAQQPPYPPNSLRPYRGGVNCVQVADANGNFNCSPLVAINPTTGAFTISLGTGPTTSVPGPLVISTSPSGLIALGNDVVISKASYTTVAPTGPGVGAVTFRVRASPRIPGYCMVVAIAGNGFGQSLEFPLAFLNPAYPLSGDPRQGALTMLSDYFVTDLPGGPGGC